MPDTQQRRMAVFSGSVNPVLAQRVSKELGIELGNHGIILHDDDANHTLCSPRFSLKIKVKVVPVSGSESTSRLAECRSAMLRIRFMP